MQFRVESFNVMNHPNFAAPNFVNDANNCILTSNAPGSLVPHPLLRARFSLGLNWLGSLRITAERGWSIKFQARSVMSSASPRISNQRRLMIVAFRRR
jgi:hypothetical protein